MLILFVCNIYIQWSQSMFDVVLNFSFLQTCGNVYVRPEVEIRCGGLLLRHLPCLLSVAVALPPRDIVFFSFVLLKR